MKNFLGLLWNSNKLKMNVLHFSDFHFGDFNLKTEEKNLGQFANFFQNFIHTLKKIIIDEKIELVMISGDFSSRNEITFDGNKIEPNLNIFLNNFSEHSIPILPCIGNHEISRKADQKERNAIFFEIINAIQDKLNINFSKDFQNNKIAYKIFESLKVIFFSMDSTFSLTSEGLWENANISLPDLDKFFEEIGQQYDLSDFVKYLVIHHTLNDIPQNKDVLFGLHERGIKCVFSGHIHDKMYNSVHIAGSNKHIANYIAGSLTLSQKRRNEGSLWNPFDLQFNEYSFIITEKKIHLDAWNWIYTANAQWEKKEFLVESGQNILICGIFSKISPKKQYYDEILNLKTNFDKNSNCKTSWEEIYKKLLKFKEKIINKKLKEIVFKGNMHLTIAFTIGFIFRITTGYNISFENEFNDEIWDLKNKITLDDAIKLSLEIENGEINSKNSVISINIGNNDILTPMKAYLLENEIKYQKILNFNYTSNIDSKLVPILVEKIFYTIQTTIPNHKLYHLFIAGPMAFFGLLATKFNMIIPLQLYAFDRIEKKYIPSISLQY